MRIIGAGAVVALTVMAAVSSVEAVDLDPNPLVLSPIEAHTLKAPHPVLGADDRLHLAYELSLVNSSPLLVTVEKISVLLPDDDQAVIQVLQGDALAAAPSRWRSARSGAPPFSFRFCIHGCVLSQGRRAPPADQPRARLVDEARSRRRTTPFGTEVPVRLGVRHARTAR